MCVEDSLSFMEGHVGYKEAARALGRHSALHFLKTETLTHKYTHSIVLHLRNGTVLKFKKETKRIPY